MTRWLFLAHRYIGIVVGVLMIMWCVSGVVMMYVSYPALDSQERLKHLAAIDWNRCCLMPPQSLANAGAVRQFSIEMLADRPVLALDAADGATELFNLANGVRIDRITLAQAASVAATYGSQAASARLLGLLDYDQWTLQGVWPSARPLYHFALADAQHSELYVSSSTGRVVQLTTRAVRFWNWLGAVPHWLYFADLRHRARLWNQVVIYTSLLGCFLTAIGLYIGVRQLILRPAGRWSPYRGFNLWHHMAGLLFGVFTLTWVLSGLLSMNPWGLLEGSAARQETARLRGAELSGIEVETALRALAAARPAAVTLQSAPLHGMLYVIASGPDSVRRRLDAVGAAAPLDETEQAFVSAALDRTDPKASLQLLTRGDNYYFSHHSDNVRFPVYRLVLGQGSGTRYYIDTVSGELLGKLNRGDRAYRWWHEALHRMDFSSLIRGRPQWDVLMWLLMSGVTTVCVTGGYLGYRRLVR